MLQKVKSFRIKKKVDGVIEAAHFGPDERLAWVRCYERRGPTFSDLVLLDRAALVERLKKRKRFYVGKRREFLASEFDLGVRIRLAQTPHGNFLIAGQGNENIPQDHMEGIPLV
jgi:hypothetical protein